MRQVLGLFGNGMQFRTTAVTYVLDPRTLGLVLEWIWTLVSAVVPQFGHRRTLVQCLRVWQYNDWIVQWSRTVLQ